MSVDNDNEIVIRFGDEVKATTDGKVRGYLVRFGGQDLEGDVFSPQCDFGRPMKIGDSVPMNLYYAHGMDPVVGKKAVGTGRIVVKEAGLWYEGQIQVSDQYREMIKRLAVEGRLGFSSGAAGHLVVREKSYNEDTNLLTVWPLAEASLTPRPAEPRNLAFAKSLSDFAPLITPNEAKCGIPNMMPLPSIKPKMRMSMPEINTYSWMPKRKRKMDEDMVNSYSMNSNIDMYGPKKKRQSAFKLDAECPMCKGVIGSNMTCKGCITHRMKSMCPTCGDVLGSNEDCPTCMAMAKDDMPMQPGMPMQPDMEDENEGPEISPATLSLILSHLMMAYQEMLSALNDGEVEEDDIDQYHSALMSNVDSFGQMLVGYMGKKKRPMKEVHEMNVLFSKSKPTSVTEFERRVREALSLSRREAKMLASHGWKALCDAVEEAEMDEVDVKSADVQSVEEVVEETTEDAEPVATEEVVAETAEEVVSEGVEVVDAEAPAEEATEEPVQEDVKSYDDEEARRVRDELTRKLLAQRMQI